MEFIAIVSLILMICVIVWIAGIHTNTKKMREDLGAILQYMKRVDHAVYEGGVKVKVKRPPSSKHIE